MLVFRRMRMRGGAALSAGILFAQITALPLLHLFHVADAVPVAAFRGDEVAARTPDGQPIWRASQAHPVHDAGSCPLCALLAHCPAGALAGDDVALAPPVALGVRSARPATVTAAPELTAAAPRAPPFRLV